MATAAELLGQFKPGQRIIEQEIAEALALSSGPARDALKIVQNKRLIVIRPYRGASVAELTQSDADEICSLRVSLEVLALHQALAIASDAQIGELTALIERMEDLLRSAERSQAQIIGTDLDFHETLVRISGHSRVASAWAALRGQVSLLMLTHDVLRNLDMSEIALAWHRLLVEEMLRRDAGSAEEMLRKHLARSYEATMLAIARQDSHARA